MTIKETLAADKAALAKAQLELASLQSKVDAQQAALRAVQPHLDLLDSIESELAMIEATVEPPIAAKITPRRIAILENLIAIRGYLIQ